MTNRETNATRAERLTAWYADTPAGAAPTAAQWAELLARPPEAPLTLINCFRFREAAAYPEGADAAPASGQEAFQRYAAVSAPTLARVGGRFLHVGPVTGALVGEGEPWDLVAIGAYPNLEALLALFEDEAYRAAFVHRAAACAEQRVITSVPLPLG